jgi:protein-S-isoprenylcysteine O-methyltransferase Ste14
MTKTMAILGSALFFVVAPSVLAGLIPWWMTLWEFMPPFFGLQATRAGGVLLIVAGVPGLVDSFARFALQGLGTPALIAPTKNLVVTGLYRYVRNPIYGAVVAVTLGEAILFGDWRLLIYGGLMWLGFHAFVLAYEEPALAETSGTQVQVIPGQRPAVDSAAVPLARSMRPPSQWRRRGRAAPSQANIGAEQAPPGLKAGQYSKIARPRISPWCR